ncbi:hypothetical protein C4559_03855 [Candidatus Microgenomates bacterium]|nr:MAG: hypothetical protein C4559_03855 [Candidatus Microgenomates bacterium]
MTATGHAILGTIIAAKVGNPALAIPIALASHVAADLFPHWDVGTNASKKKIKNLWICASIDVLLGFLISFSILFFLFPQTDLFYAFLIIIVSQSFDWITAPYYFLKLNIPPFSWMYKLQKTFDNPLDKPWGIINQAGILFLITALAKIF